METREEVVQGVRLHTHTQDMKTCVNGPKHAYSAKEAKRMRNLCGKRKNSLTVYECPYCFLWHLTGSYNVYRIRDSRRK